MLFTLRETRYDFDTDADSEERMKQHFLSLGYSVLHNSFAAIYRPATTKCPDADEVLRRRFGTDRLNWVGEFYQAVYAGDAGDGVTPGQPDLFVFRESGPEMFFCEVKKGSDVLSLGQMAGISIIHTMLGCRVQVARLNRAPRLYRWTWPNIQALHPDRAIAIGPDAK
jgi:ribosomal protein L24E